MCGNEISTIPVPGEDLINILQPQIARGTIKLSKPILYILGDRPLTITDINAIKNLNFSGVVVL